MTKDASYKRVVRRHAEETGQRYTEALTDLRGLSARMHHEPDAKRLLDHLRDRYGIDPVAATKLSVHKTYVFRIDRRDGAPWVARAFPPARPRAGVEGDAAILRFLERQGYPAERIAVDDAVSGFDGSAVLVTRLVDGVQLPGDATKFAMLGELLGRLHALPYDESADRPGGASGEDPSREGAPRQDLLAALAFLDAVDTKVPAAERERFDGSRGHVYPDALPRLFRLPPVSRQGLDVQRVGLHRTAGVLQLHCGCSPSRVPAVGRRYRADGQVRRYRAGRGRTKPPSILPISTVPVPVVTTGSSAAKARSAANVPRGP